MLIVGVAFIFFENCLCGLCIRLINMKLQLDNHHCIKKHAKIHVKSVDSLIGWEVRESSEHFGLIMSLWKRSPLFVPAMFILL